MTDEELVALVRKFRNRYLGNVILNHIKLHPEFRDELVIAMTEAAGNNKNDQVNSLLEEANLPGYPSHARLTDCCLSCLNNNDHIKFDAALLLENRTNPNLIIVGPPNQGKEKLAVAIGDYLCRQKYSVYFIEFYQLIDVLRTHGSVAASNTIYEKLLKSKCLIINDFAGIYVDDLDIIGALYILIQERLNTHTRARINPHVIFVTTNYDLPTWAKRLYGDDVQVMKIINNLLGFGNLIVYDEGR